MLEIIPFVQGPVETNAFLVADDKLKQAVVIDPAWDGKLIAEEAARRGWQINEIWLTHAHFDHIAGAAGLVAVVKPAPAVALHPDDLPLYEMQGGAPLFGMRIDPGPKPQIQLTPGHRLQVGAFAFQARHTPGHTSGHVIFYCAQQKVVFCGDVIFRGSIGRTDLPGGSYETLIHSIESQILTLPDETILYSGHGPETKVGIERAYNPFLG
jgi:hydroxyacylglutathione hydrolase